MSSSVSLRFCSKFSPFSIRFSALVISKIISNLPAFSGASQRSQWDHLDRLLLADPRFYEPAPIEVLIGAYVYAGILKDGLLKKDDFSPVAQMTKLGWIVFGSSNRPLDTRLDLCSAACHVSNDALQDLLLKFWVQEEVPSSTRSSYTPAEIECEEHFFRTHYCDESGRYVVRLPLSDSPSVLGEPLEIA